MRRGSAKGGSPAKKQKGRRSTAARSKAPKKAARPAAKGLPKASRRRAVAEPEPVAELNEARRHQAATAEILKIIAGSPSDVQPVFEQILDSIQHLLDGDEQVIVLAGDDGMLRPGAVRSSHENELRKMYPTPVAGSMTEALLREGRLASFTDVLRDPAAPAALKAIARRTKARAVVIAPLASTTRAIGSLVVSRLSARPFTESECDLVRTFADQAVIAIENARAFHETQESLEQQTVIADILKVIAASPADVQPVFDSIAASALRLCNANWSGVLLYDGETIELAALNNLSASGDDEALRTRARASFPRKLSETGVTDRAISTRATCYVPDVARSPGYENSTLVQFSRSVLSVPMLRGEQAVGAITVVAGAPNAFSERQQGLLRAFADQAVIAIQNTRSFNDTRDALARQSAMAEILEVISRSPGDLTPVFDAVLEKAALLCGAGFSALAINQGGDMHQIVAFRGNAPSAFTDMLKPPVRLGPETGVGRLVRGEPFVHILDAADDEGYRRGNPVRVALVDIAGARSYLAIPIRKDGVMLGSFTIYRREVRPFSQELIAVMLSFAAQAAIAIENARLFNETREALERQTATADILKVIASSPSDVQPVFDAIVANADKLIGGFSTGVYRFADGICHIEAFTPISAAADAVLTARFPLPLADISHFAPAVAGEIAVITDTETEATPSLQEIARARGFRSLLYAPLRSKGVSIGVIAVSRRNPGTFSAHHIELLKTFADQAVIAIENVRLFNETQEALERQTATADILKVIASSPSDVQPVFDAIAESAKRLLGSYTAMVTRVIDGVVHLAASTAEKETAKTLLPYPLSSDRIHAKVARTGELVSNADVDASTHLPQDVKDFARAVGWRSMLAVPMLRNGVAIGTVGITRREPGEFNAKAISLLKTFADQAVIAVENTRLFNETKEALAHQTATSDVLQAIGGSMADTQPVFERILDSVERLFDIRQCSIMLSPGDGLVHLAARRGFGTEALDRLYPVPLNQTMAAEVLRARRQTYFPDALHGSQVMRQAAEAGGDFSMVMTPMVWGDNSIGVISVARLPNAAFSEKELGLLRTFADQAVIAIQNARLFNDTREALAHQTATSDVLQAIGGSMADTQPVFERILDSVQRLFEVRTCSVMLNPGDGLLHLAARRGVNVEVMDRMFPVPLAQSMSAEVLATRRQTYIPDASHGAAITQRVARATADFSTVLTPMVWADNSIGVLAVTRLPNAKFSEKELALLRTFADQAVIAIQNARLFNDTREALERQIATADVLKVIASSPSDLQPVFEAIAERSNELVRGHATTVFRFIGDAVELAAFTPVSEEADAVLRASFPMSIAANLAFERVRDGDISETVDTESQDSAHPSIDPQIARARGFRSRLLVPLKSDNGVIGAISVTRKEPGAFAQKDIELLRTFADQAVIAIQNVELFEEVQARTSDLQESLQQQTATADVLKVISRSAFDLSTVMNTLAHSARTLCGCKTAALFLRDGEMLVRRGATIDGWTDNELLNVPVPLNDGSHMGRAVLTGRIANVGDLENSDTNVRIFQKVLGFKAFLGVPLMREGRGVGVFTLTKDELGPFSQRQVDLVQTFADQAVIAIENVRLFNETQEALERQTATADILKVIASSPDDVQPVFDAIAERSNRLINGLSTAVYTLVGDMVHLMSFTPVSPAADATLQASYPAPLSQFRMAVVGAGETYTIVDSEVEFAERPTWRDLARARGWRSLVGVPLHRDGKPIGIITVTRSQPGRFDDHHVQLLQTFADQAVIAIQNVRLFKETQEALERQTATADILKVIASSPDDVQPVFEAIAERSNRIVEGRSTAVYSLVDDVLHLTAFTPTSPQADAALRAMFPRALSWFRWGEAIARGEVYQVPDMQDPSTPAEGRELAVRRGFRALMVVPLMSERKIIGVISVTRVSPGKFDDHHVQLLQTFADQAVIAISNVDLFQEVQQRTKDLSRSLDDLRAAQDRLVQTEKLASLGQLTAGIAHEIKNPLNFVNNFSALSAELTGELNDLLKDAALTGKMRDEVTELTRLLQGNLEKVVQHGKRADSIVKNMLLHSREGSGEQRAADINALVDESLNLAYHGARAEKSGFNITLQRDFDADAGSVELFPQEITRALLNLISNGFYAANKRQKENGGEGFEPVLLAGTKSLGSTVEIRIRDNGTGIPPEVREKMFNPFFTTKPAGEGTGLGLSMTHDIVVKQHGGRIEVATAPGQFTEFTIVLPRTNGGGSRAQN